MLQVLSSAWALMFGMFLLMIGNGLQGSLLGIRGGIEHFSTLEMSMVMSAYFVGFLGGSRVSPELIRRVGHVRVFAALASGISAILILYPVLPNPYTWALGRLAIGFCFAGVYVTAESWLNNAADNANRGKALSMYMIVQMGGVLAAQQMLKFGDASGFILFIVPSVLVSLSFAPILLSVQPTPVYERTKPMSLRDLIRTSPTASVGMVILGGVFAAQFSMAAVYGTAVGMSVGDIATFISAFYLAALVAQYPIGWLSDRMDRRGLILVLSAVGALGAGFAYALAGSMTATLVAAALVGGASNPLYSLFIAYANDHLDPEDMASASAGFLFINGLGAIGGPLSIGWLMGAIGPGAFWMVIAICLGASAVYTGYRMTQREAPDADSGSYQPMPMTLSPVAVEVAQEVYREASEEDVEE